MYHKDEVMKTIVLIMLVISEAAMLFMQEPEISAKPQNFKVMENSNQDSLAISQVLDSYFKGIYEGDVALLGSTFYGATLLFGDVNGEPYFKTLELYLDGVKNRKSPKESGQPFRGDIVSIRVFNSIAVAEVSVKMYAYNYHELLSFHKIDGKWVIVNKMITDIPEK